MTIGALSDAIPSGSFAVCEESDNLPDPDVLVQEIVDDLEAALDQFREIATDLGGEGPEPKKG